MQEWNGKAIQAVYETGITGDKDPKIIVAPQVSVCALTGHTKAGKR